MEGVKQSALQNIVPRRRCGYTKKRNGLCSKCDSRRAPGSRYCQPCKNAYMREWRKTHRLVGEARKRANARGYAHVYRDRGHLPRRPCETCGSPEAEMHHHDYTQPLHVSWLCKPCHLAEHGKKCHTLIHIEGVTA